MSGCTCHSIREGSGGVTFSDYMLGVNCGYCESIIAEEQDREWWESLSPAEQVAYRWESARYRLADIRRRPGAPDPWANSPWGEPPF